MELSYNMFKLGEYDENTYNVGAWGACYKGIFQASVFIHNVDRCQEMADWEILDYKGQARFVRAYLLLVAFTSLWPGTYYAG
ncbi:RagB/SusD family nutrient uptake outer membrane protein [Bacteroides faecis]|uniref:RagB/SusD family nutrient uptake outer membrane protein n=1 Tax=Bacteroides faecis TaxID=674529 RepID=UPI002165D7AF|nr:RagB/SusD family nutrient uptake outer membrane protein [Bacteroides faecis]MCS3305816.1 RagB/SusD family nutrient uptake outer membrane protein [Bacteroides faecis]